MTVRTCALPERALLRRYLERGAYTDCYFADVAGGVQQAAYVEAFYTTAVFKLERLLLSWFLAIHSTDAQAREMALGRAGSFSAWNVEAREADQMLLSDFRGRTRSWLMSAPAPDGRSTRLFFGSAVVPLVDKRAGQRRMGALFRVLL